jgi:hypothetical protein
MKPGELFLLSLSEGVFATPCAVFGDLGFHLYEDHSYDARYIVGGKNIGNRVASIDIDLVMSERTKAIVLAVTVSTGRNHLQIVNLFTCNLTVCI